MNATAVIDHITAWLTGYCENAAMNGFVVGVSGGIDSAVTSTLCARTEKQTLVLNMPIHQAPEQISLTTQHTDWLTRTFSNVQAVTTELTEPFQALTQALPADIQDPLPMANTRSRLRMLTLYAFAGHHRMLVTGTGNKVEDFGIGFFTKYGDGGVDLSPIADLTKTQVYEIGGKLGVLEAILNVPPTDGLWQDNRTDESQIGAGYPELESAMAFEESGNGDTSKLTAREQEVLQIFRTFHKANRHKMVPIPVCEIPSELLG